MIPFLPTLLLSACLTLAHLFLDPWSLNDEASNDNLRFVTNTATTTTTLFKQTHPQAPQWHSSPGQASLFSTYPAC